MAVEDPKTPNLGLPLKVHGHVALQNTVKQGFEIIDAELASLDQRLAALEGAINDSNSLIP